jgi:hypothetical protein
MGKDCGGMDQAEIDQIADFLIDVRECLAGGCGEEALRTILTELYRVIERLTNAAFTARDRNLEVLMAGLENEARLCKQGVEKRLGGRD